MLYDETQSAPGAADRRPPREIEFAEALDRYVAGHVAARRRALQRRAPGTKVARRVAAPIINMLVRLGSAMSAGGRVPPIGPG